MGTYIGSNNNSKDIIDSIDENNNSNPLIRVDCNVVTSWVSVFHMQRIQYCAVNFA